jgi:catechol 2,3-dioxygenase-like lactoylglutathione lyase family enzyme
VSGLHRLLSMRVGVPDPTALASFYEEMGMVDDGHGAFGGTDVGGQVVVDEHAFRRLLEVSLGAHDEAAIDAIAARLEANGLTPRLADGALTVVEPTTEVTFRVEVSDPLVQSPAAAPPVDNRPGVATRRNARAAAVHAAPRPPRRLGHLVLATPDVSATRAFLVDGLGFKVSDEFPGIIAFLRCSTDHHNVALVGSDVPHLQHYSWECDDVDHVGHAATRLLRTDPARQAWGFGRHFLGSNFYWYLRDPAGSFLELYSDLDMIDDDEAWERDGRTAFEPSQIGRAWGPDTPFEFIVPNDIDTLRSGWAARG